MYEKDFKTLKEAAEAQKIVGGKISSFLSTNEKGEIKPHYCFFDYKNKKATTPPGWLVWSLSDGGCGVVYRRNDGKLIINTGMQGDFCYC